MLLNTDEVDDVNTIIEDSESESDDGKRSDDIRDEDSEADEDEHKTRPTRMSKRPEVYDPSRYA